jgi:aryl-alcohol dehydrogenase-like predicted oxidoreductase
MMQRRELLTSTLALGVVATLGGCASASATTGSGLLRRAIPSSGERLPVIGVGTNNYSPTTPEERAARRAVLARLTAAGASVIDTAPAYRESERTIGELLAEIGNRESVFLATKVTAQSGERAEGIAMLEESQRRLRSEVLDLVQVHNLMGARVMLPVLRDWQAQRRIRYTGITTSSANQYAEMLDLMRSEPMDFIQVDYSIANRAAAREILPLAAERRIGVLINMPFGGRRGGNLFPRVRERALPDWAAEFDATSWSQFFLKYVVSHPAVTAAIPGTTKVEHLDDNLGAARGRLPDAAQRARMEAWWDENFSTG